MKKELSANCIFYLQTTQTASPNSREVERGPSLGHGVDETQWSQIEY
jgi:hypothetical protein